MNKKKVLLISGILLTFVIAAIFIVNKNSNNEIVMKDNNKRINNSFLTLMLEQSDGTYQESTSNTWPGEGYIFNKELSSCQNGGELDWDSETNKVILYSNKSDGCYVYFDLYTKPTINSINLGEVTNNSITITVNATNGTNPITNYYYVINDSAPVSTTHNTYTFSGLDRGTTYNIEVYVVDTEGYSSEVSSLSVETDSKVYLCSIGTNLESCIINQYNGTQGNNEIYYHTSSLANSAEDNSYRYAGTNPNNYVCFGSNASACPSDNLYRIIGVFNSNVKLIKNISIGDNYWSGSSNNMNNTWSESTLNTEILNGTYLNNLGSLWSNLISTYSWKVGGMSYTNGINIPHTAYNYEVGSNSSSTTYNAKIGLMYASDYGFAAYPSAWTVHMSSYNNQAIRSTNWMYSGISEWTISCDLDNSNRAFIVNNAGIVGRDRVYFTYAVRPVFYLNSDVTYVSGTGTESDPFRIA